MRTHIATAAAVVFMIQGFATGSAAAADRYGYKPEAGVYVSYSFGGPTPKALPMHYGLMMKYEGNPLAFSSLPNLPPLLTLDFDYAGSGLAMISGIPFMYHIARLDQNGTPGDSDEQTRPGGFNVVDWGLLGLGVAGIGYGISQVAQSKDSPDAQRNTSQAGGGLLGGLTAGGATTNQFAPGYDAQTDLLLLNGSETLVFGENSVERPDQSYNYWLNGGTGHMGDLDPR